ncbi:hypothetical protein NM688_g1226 [Phlebia brevispora]|uniref:Uncharacterized protein n=1 Tax=Phlebia brevispora TaxID=194682 RepID=A0ACC1TC35_9APHY|nr:hypothetical protein NM688_g1226 [Phlebia brevispora]
MNNALMSALLVAAEQSQTRNAQNPELRPTISIDQNVTEPVRSLPVKHVRLHGCMSVTPDGLDQVVHWRLFFGLHTANDESLEVNSQKFKFGDMTTRLFIRHCPYEESMKKKVDSKTFVFTPGVVHVQDIIDLLVRENTRDQYRLDERGSGCLFWCLTILDDLESKGWIPASSAKGAQTWIVTVRDRVGTVLTFDLIHEECSPDLGAIGALSSKSIATRWLINLDICRMASAPTSNATLSEFDGLSDEEAIAFLDTYDFSQRQFVSESGIQRPVWRISQDTVVKCLGSRDTTSWRGYEAYTMSLVASQTTIAVPRIRKQVVWRGFLYVFMEYVQGEDLINIWPSLSWWHRFKIVWTLRSYVQQLRKVFVPPVPGPVDGSGQALVCMGHFFTEAGDGPFSSYAKLSAWYASKRRITIALEKERCAIRKSDYTAPDIHFDNSLPLVLTHGDISQYNVRLGHDGTVWLLDWGRSGVYPQWFEYASIMAYDDFSQRTPRSWLWFAPFIAGWYKSQNYFMQRISLALIYYGLEDPEPDATVAPNP